MSNTTVPTPANPAGWKFETRQIHAGQAPDAATGARALPIYQTTSFVFENAEQAANRFALAELGPIYTRLNNPTQEVIENRIASLEGGVGALLLASGQAAITYAILNIAGAGDHIVASPSIYGGTYNLLKYTLADLGVETTFVENPDDLQQWRDAVRPNTKLFYGETVPNPRNDVLDIEPIAQIAHDNGVPLIVDNTVPTPYLVRPIEFGADVVIHSATKYLGGHGTSIGGVIVDSGNFDYGADPEKFPKFNEPAPGYHGLVYARDLGKDSAFGANLSYILKARVSLLRDTGAAISPTNAFNIGIGLETLSLRIERHIENATKVANWLEEHPLVDQVIWAGLVRASPKIPAEGTGRRCGIHPQRRRPGTDSHLCGCSAAALQCCEYRRCTLACYSPCIHHPLAAFRGRARGNWGEQKLCASLGRYRKY